MVSDLHHHSNKGMSIGGGFFSSYSRHPEHGQNKPMQWGREQCLAPPPQKVVRDTVLPLCINATSRGERRDEVLLLTTPQNLIRKFRRAFYQWQSSKAVFTAVSDPHFSFPLILLNSQAAYASRFCLFSQESLQQSENWDLIRSKPNYRAPRMILYRVGGCLVTYCTE